MSEIIINKSDMAVSFSIILENSLATSEISKFPKELAINFINDSNLNIKQKKYMQEILNESNDVFFYSRLKVPDNHKNKGFGTQLLQKTLSFIQESNSFLVNTASAYGKGSQEDLIKFYQKNGMILTHDYGGLVYQKNLNLENLNSFKIKKPKF